MRSNGHGYPLSLILGALLRMLLPAISMIDERFYTGVSLFNARAFFECHDVWEDLWMDTVGSDKRLYQGLIQAAVAFYHAENGNNRGASNLLARAIEKLTEYPPRHHEMDCAALRASLADHLAQFRRRLEGEQLPFDVSTVPLIHLST